MIALGTLPPRFLVPAWSYGQVQQLASQRKFSNSQYRKAAPEKRDSASSLIRCVYIRNPDSKAANVIQKSAYALPKSADVDELRKTSLQKEAREDRPVHGRDAGSVPRYKRIPTSHQPDFDRYKVEASDKVTRVSGPLTIREPAKSRELRSAGFQDEGKLHDLSAQLVYSEHARLNRERQTHQDVSRPLDDISGHSRKSQVTSHTPDQIDKKGLSLFDQLFPEDVKRKSVEDTKGYTAKGDPPQLPPLDFEVSHELPGELKIQSTLASRIAVHQEAINDLRQESTTILVLSRATTALSEVDFQRIIPKGKHLEWRGPGDILKVIPARDYSSLSPKAHYYLFFRNLADARAYQEHVARLHQSMKPHGPNSPKSYMVTRSDENEDLDIEGSSPQEYTLSPPSVRLTLHLLKPPYRQNLCEVIKSMGYSPLVEPDDKSSRAVLFWVDGYQPSTLSLRTMLSKDGHERGLQWGPLRGLGDIKILDITEGEEGDTEEAEGTMWKSAENFARHVRDSGVTARKPQVQRWIISFEDEVEARRFVRVWHRKPYTLPLQNESPSQGEPSPLVHAEFLW